MIALGDIRIHRIEEQFVGKPRIAETQLGEGRAFFTQGGTHGEPRRLDHSGQLLTRRRGLQILDDDRLDAGIADQRECVTRGCALRIVVDGDFCQAMLSS